MGLYACPDCHRVFHYEKEEFAALVKREERRFRDWFEWACDPGAHPAPDPQWRESPADRILESNRSTDSVFSVDEEGLAKELASLKASLTKSLEEAVGHVLCPSCDLHEGAGQLTSLRINRRYFLREI